MKKEYTLNKQERLKSRKLIELTFSQGESFSAFPLKVFYLMVKEPSGALVQAGFGVSTRNFKKATDRNRIKRLMKEAYRIEKAVLETTAVSKKIRLSVFFIYTAKELPQHTMITEKIGLTLKRLQKKADEKYSESY